MWEGEKLKKIRDAVFSLSVPNTQKAVQNALDAGCDPMQIVEQGLSFGMTDVGDKWLKKEMFTSHVLVAAKAMAAGQQLVEKALVGKQVDYRASIVLGTPRGDLHDIGKNLVGMMLEGAGYQVFDLGVNQTKDDILAHAEELRPDVVGLSALLTTSMPSMAKTVAAFKDKALTTPVIVGGAPVTEAFAEAIGADGYGENAPGAVALVNGLVEGPASRRERAA